MRALAAGKPGSAILQGCISRPATWIPFFTGGKLGRIGAVGPAVDEITFVIPLPGRVDVGSVIVLIPLRC
jgi:hypothetical protein